MVNIKLPRSLLAWEIVLILFFFFILGAQESLALTSTPGSLEKKNPFTSEQDPSRLAKRSFRIYIESITLGQFDIIMTASDEIAWTLEMASGFRLVPRGGLRLKVPVTVFMKNPEFIDRYGNLKQRLIVESTDFLEVTETKIVIKSTFSTMETTPSMEVFDILTFKRDEKGWLFDGYSDAGKGYPCSRPKKWREPFAPCQEFQR